MADPTIMKRTRAWMESFLDILLAVVIGAGLVLVAVYGT